MNTSKTADLQAALALLRDVSADASKLPGDTAEAIDDFLDKMEQPIVTVRPDSSPTNPRTEGEYAGRMYCRVPRYNLGDDDAEDPFEERQVYTWEGVRLNEDQYDHAYDCLTNLVLNARTDEGRRFWNASLTAFADEGNWNTVRTLRSDIAIALPIYAYIHGGITVSHGRFSDPWDSGCAGVHYMTRETLDREFGGDEAKARACLEAELTEYDDYLMGNVWTLDIESRSGEPIECCGNFIGSTLEATGMLEHVEERYQALLAEAWEQRFA